MMQGAKQAMDELASEKMEENPCYQYAALRNILYENGKSIELLISYEPHFHYFSEWWKQLFAESEGKHQQGIFPTAAQFTTDLHSLGQYIQDGERHLFETVLHIEQTEQSTYIPMRQDDLD